MWFRRHREALVGVAAVAGAVVLVGWLVLYVLPPTLASDAATDPAKAESDARTALIQVVAGLVLLGGLFFTARTLQLNRQGQITDRFTKAIAQLGDDKLDVRLGGIYALERIARDSAADHRTIMEVLTAFVREHSARAAQDEEEDQPPRDVEPSGETPPSSTPDAIEKSPRRLRADLKAIVTVLGRRRVEHEGASDRINLDGARLGGVNLEGFRLGGADLRGARLEGADLGHAKLEEATLDGARLEGANLMGANLVGANLVGARLEGANLSDANLKAAYLTGANLEEANLVNAHLVRADLMGARLVRANLGEDTSRTFYLPGAILTGANLEGPDFTGANLVGADFTLANLEGVTWPDGFEPPGAGAT